MSAPSRQRLLTGLVIAFLLAGSVSIVVDAILGLAAYRDVGYPDSGTLLRLRDLVDHGLIYPDSVNRPPYYVSIYGPLSYVLLAIPFRMAQTFGLDTTLTTRAGALAAFLVCIPLVFLISRKLSNSSKAAGFSAIFAVSSYYMGGWTTQIRCDFLGVAFALTAVYLFLLTKHRPQALFSAVVAGLAALIKQTFVATGLAVVAWLLYRRRYKEAAYWAATYCLVVAGGYALTWWHEPFMGQHLAALRNPRFEFHDAFTFIGIALNQPMTPFALIGALLIFSKRLPESTFISFYWIAAWFIGFITIPQAGGGLSYFWESLLCSAILAGPALIEIVGKIEETPLAPRALIYASFLCWLIPSLHLEAWHLKQDAAVIAHYRSNKAAFQAFARLIAGHRFISTYSDLTLLSKEPEVPDPLLNTILEDGGRWSYQPVVEQMDQRSFEFVAFTTYYSEGWRGRGFWDKAMIQSLKTHYWHACTFQDIQIWLPDGTSSMLPQFKNAGCESANSLTSRSRPAAALQ